MGHELDSILTQLSSSTLPDSDEFLSGFTMKNAIESAFDMIVVTDLNGIVYYANPAATRVTGYSPKEIVGKSPRLWGGRMGKDFYKNLWDTINAGKVFTGEMSNRRKNGDLYDARIVISPITKGGQVIGFMGTEEDITLEKQLSQEKEDFISLVSHQLRTPLGSMKWSFELLLEKKTGLEHELRELANINQEMIDMINRMLLVMRIKDNRLELQNAQTNLNDLVKKAMDHFKSRIAEKNQTIVPRLPEPPVTVTTDAGLVFEILCNLVDNAIKYSDQGKEIGIEVSTSEKNWQLKVTDNGVGIPQEDLPRIYEKYFRSSNVKSVAGTGLGLYVINTYIQKMKGAITIKSELNKGTEITCSFPLIR